VIVVQVNGKLRSRVMVGPASSDEEVKEAALKDGKIQEWILGKEVKKVILVPGRLVNVVVA
jgi:leucyl-tRNA synthetase